MDCECLYWFSSLQGPTGKPGLPGMPGADGPPVSPGNMHTYTQASRLLISSSIVCGSERFHCINNYSIVICLAVLSHFRLHRHTLFTSVLKAFSIHNTNILWFYNANYCHIFVSQTQGHPGKEGPSGEKGNMVCLSFIFINTYSLA